MRQEGVDRFTLRDQLVSAQAAANIQDREGTRTSNRGEQNARESNLSSRIRPTNALYDSTNRACREGSESQTNTRVSVESPGSVSEEVHTVLSSYEVHDERPEQGYVPFDVLTIVNRWVPQ